MAISYVTMTMVASLSRRMRRRRSYVRWHALRVAITSIYKIGSELMVYRREWSSTRRTKRSLCISRWSWPLAGVPFFPWSMISYLPFLSPKAYTTVTCKRRKVYTDKNGNETRWHKTGKTRLSSPAARLRGTRRSSCCTWTTDGRGSRRRLIGSCTSTTSVSKRTSYNRPA